MNKELLQQALDAFEVIFETTMPYRDDGECTFHASAISRANEAIAALIAAIAQPAKPVAWFEYNQNLDAWFLAYGYNAKAKTRPLFEHPTIAQPEQLAPVAWMTKDGRVANNATKQTSMANPSKRDFNIPLYLSCAIAQPKQPAMPEFDCWQMSNRAMYKCDVGEWVLYSDVAAAWSKATAQPASQTVEHVYHLRQYGDVSKVEMGRYIATGDINAAAPIAQPAAVPKPPSHPEPHTFTWSRYELKTIEDYGKQCFEAAIAQPAVSQFVQLTTEEQQIAHDLVWSDAVPAQPADHTSQEPVGYVYWNKGHSEGALNVQNLKPGTPLYTSPQTAQPVQPVQPASKQGEPIGCVAKDGYTILYFQVECLPFETELYIKEVRFD